VKGISVPFFGPIYQIIFTVIVISFVFMCVNTLVSSNNIYYEFLAIGDTLESVCNDEIAAGPGPDLPRGFFMIQLTGLAPNCMNILELLDDDGKFRSDESCSYDNCLGSFCLCMGKSTNLIGFTDHDMVTSGTPNPDGILNIPTANNDRDAACDDLANSNVYNINPSSMCCVKIPTEDCGTTPPSFLTMVEESGYVIFDGIYAKEDDITITSINFQMTETPFGQMLEILKI
jgi:hypothetical protein